MFAIAFGAILGAVIGFLAYPFRRKSRAPNPAALETFQEVTQDQERVDLEIEKQRMLTSLWELEFERSQGRLTPEDHQQLKATDESRLVKVLDQLDQLSEMGPAHTQRLQPRSPQGRMVHWLSPIILGLLVASSASGIYIYVDRKIGLEAQRGAREAQAQSAPGGQGMPNPLEMVARLEARLRENPDDLQGQIMAGRSYMTLQRFDDAKKAWSKVIELNQRDHEAHFNLGLILVQSRETADPGIFEEALAHFDTALINIPREPVVLWYRGVVLVHLKRYREADESWTTAYQNFAPGSEDAEFVRQALQKLRAGNSPLS